jgi:hypothetical protein
VLSSMFDGLRDGGILLLGGWANHVVVRTVARNRPQSGMLCA